MESKYAYYDLNDSNYIILYYLINTVLFIKNRRLVSKPRDSKINIFLKHYIVLLIN